MGGGRAFLFLLWIMAKQREHLAWSRALQHLARSGALCSTAFNYWVIWSLARLVTVEAAQISNLTGRESSNLACHIVRGGNVEFPVSYLNQD